MGRISKYDDSEIIKLRQEGLTWEQVGERMNASSESVRWYARKQPWYESLKDGIPLDNFKKQENRSDGSISSTIKEKLKEKKVLTNKDLLEIHGLDPEEFQIRTIVSNEWSMTNAEGSQYWNFQSKIIAEPIKEAQTIVSQIKEIINSYNQPFSVKNLVDEFVNSYLFIPSYDPHFGINTSEDYQRYQDDILKILENNYKEVVLVLGGDIFNANDFRSQTINQTRVDDTSIPEAWEEALLFYCPIIEKALAHTKKFKIVYNRGNHDETISWAFTKYLEAKYPQVEFDVSVKQMKATVLGKHVFFTTHGHIKRNLNKVIGLCSALFPTEWGKSKQRFLITGHNHFDKSEDNAGITHFQVTSPSKATTYEEENMFQGTQVGMRLFELDEERLTAIYYLQTKNSSIESR